MNGIIFDHVIPISHSIQERRNLSTKRIDSLLREIQKGDYNESNSLSILTQIQTHMISSEECDILHLPVEILIHILEYATPTNGEDLLLFSSTCKLFRRILFEKKHIQNIEMNKKVSKHKRRLHQQYNKLLQRYREDQCEHFWRFSLDICRSICHHRIILSDSFEKFYNTYIHEVCISIDKLLVDQLYIRCNILRLFDDNSDDDYYERYNISYTLKSVMYDTLILDMRSRMFRYDLTLLKVKPNNIFILYSDSYHKYISEKLIDKPGVKCVEKGKLEISDIPEVRLILSEL